MQQPNPNRYKVNWVDGMKINKSHFVDTENALLANAQHLSLHHIHPANYGLLPLNGTEQAVKIILSIDAQDVIKVELMQCKAITQGGVAIDIHENISTLLKNSGYILQTTYAIPTKDADCFVVLGVDPFSKIPIGEADIEEEPPRHPYALPKYTLNIVEDSQRNALEFGQFHLTIAKIVFRNQKPELDKNYIPPCTSMQSHQDLIFIYEEIENFLNTLENKSLAIIQKIYQRKQKNDLADMVLAVSENLLQHLSGILPSYRLLDRYAPPIQMICKLVGIARVFKNSMDRYAGTGKEALLNYLSDWTSVTQGEFEQILSQMLALDYQHTDINASFQKTAKFTKLLLGLFKKLNELEYIGKKSDSAIFVKEEVVTNPEIKERRSFLLD